MPRPFCGPRLNYRLHKNEYRHAQQWSRRIGSSVYDFQVVDYIDESKERIVWVDRNGQRYRYINKITKIETLYLPGDRDEHDSRTFERTVRPARGCECCSQPDRP